MIKRKNPKIFKEFLFNATFIQKNPQKASDSMRLDTFINGFSPILKTESY